MNSISIFSLQSNKKKRRKKKTDDERAKKPRGFLSSAHNGCLLRAALVRLPLQGAPRRRQRRGQVEPAAAVHVQRVRRGERADNWEEDDSDCSFG